MLGDKNAAATIAVKDIDRARTFYEGKLGLRTTGGDSSEVRLYKSGDSFVLLYQSQFAGTNKATSATWGVGKELEPIVRDLQAKGVPFEHYDLPGLTRDGDFHVMGEFKGVWIKDPDGNILHLNNM
jgi:catechol 2,3-dioxygenase-like lactoylglutathione lyase family enzyme